MSAVSDTAGVKALIPSDLRTALEDIVKMSEANSSAQDVPIEEPNTEDGAESRTSAIHSETPHVSPMTTPPQDSDKSSGEVSSVLLTQEPQIGNLTGEFLLLCKIQQLTDVIFKLIKLSAVILVPIGKAAVVEKCQDARYHCICGTQDCNDSAVMLGGGS